MTTAELTLTDLMQTYFLQNDLKPQTEAWYRRVLNVYRKWYGSEPKESELTADALSRFLRDKQMTSVSAHYVRSLRHGLLAFSCILCL